MMILADICVILSSTFFLTIFFATFWAIFDKAGQPGWASFTPIYGAVVLVRVMGKPMWWLALFFVPCLNFITLPIVLSILMPLELGKRFGWGGGGIAGLIFFPGIFFPILAFGSSEYIPPETA